MNDMSRDCHCHDIGTFLAVTKCFFLNIPIVDSVVAESNVSGHDFGMKV